MTERIPDKSHRKNVGALVENAIHHYMEYYRGRCSLDTMAGELEKIKDKLAAPSARGTTEQVTFFKGVMAGWPGMARDADRLMMESILAVLKRQTNDRTFDEWWATTEWSRHDKHSRSAAEAAWDAAAPPSEAA